MRIFKLIVSLFILISLKIVSPADNIYMASDLGWKCLGSDSFMIKLTLYIDCTDGSMPSSETINFNSYSAGTFLKSITIATQSSVDITPTCHSDTSKCQNPSSTFPLEFKNIFMKG